MSLNDKLNAVKEEFSKTAPQEALKTIGAAIGNLMESGFMDRAPKVGEAMPLFELADSEDRLMSSADLISSGPMVLHFYRGVW